MDSKTDTHVLSSLHLSSVFASSAHVPTHAVPTARRDIPLATARSDIPDEHASFSSLFNSTEIGHVLIRVVQGGLAVELVSLSYNVSPIRFVFPATIIPNPALVAYGGRTYLIVVTSVGTLFRLSVPSYPDGQLWHGPLSKNWCKEWQIKKLGGAEPKLVHVHDAHDVAIALSYGGYLRLENKSVNSRDSVQWIETEWKSINWYSAFIPAIGTSRDYPEEIVSMSSAPSPTDLSDLFSISRDRVLRRWTVAKGCRSELVLDTSRAADDTSSLLDPHPQKLLRVLTTVPAQGAEVGAEESVFVIVFVASPSSPTTGGTFRVYNADRYQWKIVYSIDATPESAHCRLQDFVVNGDSLYVLWEKQGESMLETTHISLENLSSESRLSNQTAAWRRVRLDNSSKINSDAMNELLLQPGSLTDKFLQSILRPGLFSVVTLRAALQDYQEHYLSLPGPHPKPLLATYATLGENIAAVVGCTVALTRDPHTGVTLHNQYWNALRRDWEGFLARCTEIERSARWPVCAGLDANGQILVVERERISQCVQEDAPMQLHQRLLSTSNEDPGCRLLSICWAVRTKLSEPLVRRIETETISILHQEYSFPLADIIAEASARVFTREEIEDDLISWVDEQLSTIRDFNSTVRRALEVIASLSRAVKQEEDEVELILPPVILEWTRALATSYLTETIEARYDLCLALSVLFFFMGESLKESQVDPVLLAEVFAIIRGVAMCRYICRQPAGDLGGAKPMPQQAETEDDVATRLSTMYVSREPKNPSPSYSLAHQLLSEYGHPPVVLAAVHHFLDQLGLFSNTSPAHVTRSEVVICEKLRLMGYSESARYLLSWLPRTPAVCYVSGRLWIDGGREDEAATLLQSVSGAFGPGNVILSDDLQSLDAILPSGCCHSDCVYYLHVADLFKRAGMTSHEVHFLRLALSVWPEGGELDEVSQNTWASIIKGYSDLGLYDDAYCYLISFPHRDQKQQYVSNLVYKMCENNALDRLLSMNFRGLVQEVEAALSFKARNADPRSLPNWSQVLYTWYTIRGDYRNAALTMYIRYRRLSDLHGDATTSISIVEQQAEALSIAMNALGLVESKNAYLTVPTYDASLPPRKRRKLGNYLPKDQLVSKQRNIEVVKLSDIEKEYAHLTANTELIRRDPTLIRHGEPPLTPWLTVSKLTQAGLYDLAMTTAKALSVDMVELFQRLTLQCLHLSGTTDSALIEAASSDWLLTDKVSSWSGTPTERAWRYLRQCLGRYDSVETDFRYSKAVLETLLSNDQSPPPPWLLQTIEEYHPEHLIRAFLRFGNVQEALERSLKLIRKSNTALDAISSKQASCTWLPYSVIDAVLKSSEDSEDSPAPQLQKQRQALQKEVTSRILRLRKDAEKLSPH
ncbi:hypothetical protein ACEPAH_5723 [Sanghuangporus vaninii]